jgi:hypothetical protein
MQERRSQGVVVQSVGAGVTMKRSTNNKRYQVVEQSDGGIA